MYCQKTWLQLSGISAQLMHGQSWDQPLSVSQCFFSHKNIHDANITKNVWSVSLNKYIVIMIRLNNDGD